LPATQTIAKQANVQGGNEVEKLNAIAEDSVVEITETAIVEETVVASNAPAVEDAPAADSAEDADSASVDVFKSVDAPQAEAAVEEPDFAKMLVDLKGFFADTLSKATEANAVQVSEIKETVETFSKSVNAQITELAEKHSALSAAVTEIKGTIDGVQKRVDAVEGDTAIKKSSDLGGSVAPAVNKSKWNGSFLGSVNEIFN